ncbi:MAG TPA: transglycosylase SLT domain-containing protein [Kofleriaceae bacterium]
MRRGIAVCLVVWFGCADGDAELEWVAPMEEGPAPIGDAIELAVATDDPDAQSVAFSVDGTQIAVCDPAQPEEDCKRDDVWRWTTVFSTTGVHVVEATLRNSAGETLATTSRAITVVRELVDIEHAQIDEDRAPDQLGDTTDDIGQLDAAGRGLLDPDRGYHSIFGGIQWRVLNQRVRLHSGTPAGSVSAVRACMNRYGASIRHWADHYSLSRASVVATALTESNCTNPAGSSDGLSSGPMQVTASTCAALTGLSRSTCRSRMHTQPDFSFQVGAKYMGSSYQRNQHHRDPPKIAAAYNAGSLRKSFANRWHMVSTGNHIDRFVQHYNAYRLWESQ